MFQTDYAYVKDRIAQNNLYIQQKPQHRKDEKKFH